MYIGPRWTDRCQIWTGTLRSRGAGRVPRWPREVVTVAVELQELLANYPQHDRVPEALFFIAEADQAVDGRSQRGARDAQAARRACGMF